VVEALQSQGVGQGEVGDEGVHDLCRFRDLRRVVVEVAAKKRTRHDLDRQHAHLL
jgi:hypothetical protein